MCGDLARKRDGIGSVPQIFSDLGGDEELLPADVFLFERGRKGAPDLFLVEVAPGWTQQK